MIDICPIIVVAVFVVSLGILVWDNYRRGEERAEWEADVRRSIARSYVSLWRQEKEAPHK